MRISDLRGVRIGGLVSGGLDSCTITHWLQANGAEPHCYTLDLGQPDESNLEEVRRRMLACGAVAAHVIDGREALAEAGLQVIQSQARYEGGYWNTTGIARYVTTRLAVEALERDVAISFPALRQMLDDLNKSGQGLPFPIFNTAALIEDSTAHYGARLANSVYEYYLYWF